MAGALGGLLIGCIGVLLPPVMFWGEWEIQNIASGAPLPHIWPKGALRFGPPHGFLPGSHTRVACHAPDVTAGLLAGLR